MKVIIDAGSTKSDVAILSNSNDSKQVLSFDGMNPVTDVDYWEKLSRICTALAVNMPATLYYYGAGCINEEINSSIANFCLEHLSTLKKCLVEDDILGAAIATMGAEKGMICILGTGSNTAVFDGERIIRRIHSGGYLLGDEGSGFRLGQLIYLHFTRAWLTNADNEIIRAYVGIRQEEATAHLYKQTSPRSYLASFAKLLPQLSPELQERVTNEIFDQFIQKMVLPIIPSTNTKVHFVGSIGYQFQDILRLKLSKEGLSSGRFLRQPIEGLMRNHR